jgi:hypothetical protein
MWALSMWAGGQEHQVTAETGLGTPRVITLTSVSSQGTQKSSDFFF